MKTRMTLTELNKTIPEDAGFTAVGASYIVNMRCVQSLLGICGVKWRTVRRFPFRDVLRGEVKKQYFDFYTKEATGNDTYGCGNGASCSYSYILSYCHDGAEIFRKENRVYLWSLRYFLYRSDAGCLRDIRKRLHGHSSDKLYFHHTCGIFCFHTDINGYVLQETVFIYQSFFSVLHILLHRYTGVQRTVRFIVGGQERCMREIFVRTLLYVPAVIVYLKFLRPICACSAGERRKRTWYSISLVSILFLEVFASFCRVFLRGIRQRRNTLSLWGGP